MKRSVLIIAVLLALLVGYVDLRLPVTVGAQGGDAVYRTLRTEIPIEPRYLGTGTPAVWTYLRGDGVWAGVSPPTRVSSLTSLLSTNSSSYVDTGLSVTLDLPAATSDVLLNARTYQYHSCEIGIARDGTILTSAETPTTGSSTIEYTHADQNPGMGSHTYSVQARKNPMETGICSINSSTGGFSVLIGQVLR